MKYYFENTKIGFLTVLENQGYIEALGFNKINFNADFKKTALIEETFKQFEQYFKKERKKFELPYRLKGTDFQKKVWAELLKIPYGKTKTYKEIACLINHKNANRAVGSANNKNPIPIIIPCHRVIASNGNLAGYRGGLDIKKKLLETEGCL